MGQCDGDHDEFSVACDPPTHLTSAATRRRATAPGRSSATGGGEEQNVDRMSGLDAGFFFAESENTPMHVGSVAVFEGPAPSLRRRRPAAAEQAAAGTAVPPARARGADAARPAAVGRRPALPDPLPRAAHRGARPGQRRAAAQPRRPRARPAPRHGQAALGALAGRGPRRQPLGDHLQGPPLHGRRRRRHRPDAADVRPRARRDARGPEGLDAAAHARRASSWSPTRSPRRVAHPLRAAALDADREQRDAGGARALAESGHDRSPRPCPRWPSRRSPRRPGR